jgi:hypothetical protein
MKRCIAIACGQRPQIVLLGKACPEPDRLLIDATSYLSPAKAPGRDWSKTIATRKSTVARLR